MRGSYIPCNVLISNIFQVWLRLCEVWPWLLTPCCQFRRNRKACFLMRLFGVYCSAGFYNSVNIDLAYLNNYLKRLSTFIESLKAFYPKFACELNLLHSYAFKSFVKKFVILSFKFWVVSKSTIIFYIYIYIYISGGPLSALTCCVNVRLLSGDKKNIAVNLFSKLGWELGLYYASYDDFHPDILARMYT